MRKEETKEVTQKRKNNARYDVKGRRLRNGEMQTTEGKYAGRYRYQYSEDGKVKTLYAWRLTKNDANPTGRKMDLSLREKEEQRELDVQNKVKTDDGNKTVYELMVYHTDKMYPDVKESTRSGYRTQLKFMKDEPFGKKKIKEIDEEMAEKWFKELHTKRGKNYSSLCTLKGILKPAFTRARKNKWIRTPNPFMFSMSAKFYGKNNTREALTRKNMRLFLDFCRTDKHFMRYFDGFYILFNTGLRISEFCGLTIDDIDFERKEIHVRRQLIRIHDGDKTQVYIETLKTVNSNRTVPFIGDVEQAFRNVIANRHKLTKEHVVYSQDKKESATGFIFLNNDGELSFAQHWSNWMRRARDKYNNTYKDEIDQQISPHVARHTFCSNMASAGMRPKTLQAIMGHSEISITLNVYTHAYVEDLHNEVNALAENKQYDFYSLSRYPDIVSLNNDDDDYDMGKPDFTEFPDDCE